MSSPKSRLLIVDDEKPIRKLLQQVLEQDDHTCHTASSVEEAKNLLKDISFDLVITDLKLPVQSGLSLLQFMAKNYPETGRVMMTGYSTDQVAKEAIEIGIYGYLIKPLNKDMVRITINNALNHMQMERKVQERIEVAESELVKRNYILNQIVDNLDVGVTLYGRDSNAVEFNKTMYTIFPHLSGKRIFSLNDIIERISQNDPNDICHSGVVFESGKPCSGEVVYTFGDVSKEIKITALPILSGSEVDKVLTLYHDVTDILQAQKEDLESSKLLTVGQLAMGIAHEINTPIQFIGDNTNFLEDSFKEIQEILGPLVAASDQNDRADKEKAEEYDRLLSVTKDLELDYLVDEIPATISQTQGGIKKIAEIVKAMKKFAHPGEDVKEQSNINEMIKTTLTVCKSEWKYSSTISLNLASDLPLVSCFPTEISQVILILVVNAAHAIEEKRKVEENSFTTGTITIETKLKDASSAQIQISDTGNGIAKENQEKVWEAFFTTKERGKGSGQGLSLARNIIVENHHGDIDFSSEVGVGTTFTIDLPIQ